MTPARADVARWTVLVALCVAMQPSLRAEEQETYLYVVVNDRAILEQPAGLVDGSFASLVVEPGLRLAESGRRFTKKLDCEAGCTWSNLTDLFFDYYPGKWLESAAQIADWIRVSNEPPPETATEWEVVLPAIPMKVHEEFPFEGVRLYDATNLSYQQASSLQHLETLTLGVEPLREFDLRRQANYTILKLTREEYERSYGGMAASEYFTVYSGGPDFATTGAPPVTILLNDDCGEMMSSTFLEESPFKGVWLEARDSLDSYDPAELTTKAGNDPLVLIDWDFQSGHGSRVAAVVSAALTSFGFGDLPFVTVDLHPRRSPEKLEAIVKSYCNFLESCVASEPPPQPRFTDSPDQLNFWRSLTWIRSHIPPNEDSIEQDVDQFVLQAVLWKYLRSGSLVNLSFSLRDDEAPPITHYLIDRKLPAIVAAGNDQGPLSALFSPQNLARNWPDRIINVTYGGPDGSVLGSYSSTQGASRTDVALVAQGECFTHEDFPPQYRGSSFASPLVASAAWIRLLAGGSISAGDLMRACRPVPSNRGKVVSEGFFDPYLLLAGRRPLVIFPGGEPIAPVSGTVELTWQDEEASPSDTIDLAADRTGTMRFYRDPSGGLRVHWVRHAGAMAGRDVPVVSVSSWFVTQDGETMELTINEIESGLEIMYGSD